MKLVHKMTGEDEPIPTAGSYVVWRQGDDILFHWFRDSDTDSLLNLTEELIANNVLDATLIATPLKGA